jgi:hypothetical protein
MDVAGQEGSRELRLALEQKVVVPGHHDLVRMRLQAEPRPEGRDLEVGPSHGEITRMNEGIADRQVERPLLIVSVGNQYEPHRT